MNQRISRGLTLPNFVNGIILINAVMYLICLFFTGHGTGLSLSPSADVLNFMGASGRIPIDRFQAWGSLITANWLHGSLLHILFNMMALRTVAPLVAGEFGMARMFTIYTLSGAAGFLSYLGNVPLTIGASSGLCGLIGALLYYGRSKKGPWGRMVFKQTAGWIGSLALIGFLLPNINNWGHGGGLAAGIALGWLLKYQSVRPEQAVDKRIALILAGITLILLIRPVVAGTILLFT